MTDFATGATGLLSLLLFAAGILKLANPRAFGWAMLRLISPAWAGWRVVPPGRAGYVVGAIEVITAVIVIVLPGPAGYAAAAWMAFLYVSFIPAVGLAIKRGSSCGCWGSLSDGVAGGAELGRAASLGVMAVAVAVARVAGADLGWTAPALVVALGLAGVTFAAAWTGGLALPVRSRAKAMRNPVWDGVVGSQLALFAGSIGNRLAGFDPPQHIPRQPDAADERQNESVRSA
jgi:hypothetical protein